MNGSRLAHLRVLRSADGVHRIELNGVDLCPASLQAKGLGPWVPVLGLDCDSRDLAYALVKALGSEPFRWALDRLGDAPPDDPGEIRPNLSPLPGEDPGDRVELAGELAAARIHLDRLAEMVGADLVEEERAGMLRRMDEASGRTKTGA